MAKLRASLLSVLAVGVLVATPGCYKGVGSEGGGADGDEDGEDPGDEEGGAVDAFCEEDTLPGQLSHFVRLTHRQYDNSVQTLLGIEEAPSESFLGDPAVEGFTNNADQLVVTNRLARDYRRAAEELSDTLLTDGTTLAGLLAEVGCSPEPDPDACAQTFIADFGRRAFRRALDDEEQADFFGLYGNADSLYESGTSFEKGIVLVIETMLQSPSFLYRVELSAPAAGDSLVRLSGYEVASRLSYMLWNSPPDDELLAAAEAGELDDPSGLEDHARRLLADPRAADPIEDFHFQWLKMDRYPNITKDPDLYPDFDMATTQSMAAETLAFFRTVILEQQGTYADLMTSRQTFVDENTAPIYGLSGQFGPELTPVEVDPATRSGFLTQPGFLALNAYFAESSPIHRGVFVQRRILCTPIPDPPGNVDLNLPPFDENLKTTRQRVEAHTSPEACTGCHTLINAPGFAFEGYDAIGVARTTENGVPVDTTGSITTSTAGEGEITFTNAVDLIQQLSASPTAQHCYLEQWFQYASSRLKVEDDQCTIDGMHDVLLAENYDVQELLVALTQTVSFRYRAAQEGE